MNIIEKINFYFKTLNVYIHYHLHKKYSYIPPIPFALYLSLTYRCNQKCKFCNHYKNRKTTYLKIQDILHVINDASKLKIPYISIFGGEPLIRQDLEQIALKIKKKNIFLALTTNGTLITKKRACLLVNLFDTIKISFVGLERNHDLITGVKGSYKKTIIGLNHLISIKNRKARIILHYIVNNSNYTEMNKFTKEFKEKVDLISFLPENYGKSFFSNKFFIKKWLELSKKYNIGDSKIFINNIHSKKKYCDAGKLYYTILPTGEVNACNAYKKIILGNIHNISFYDIWKQNLEIKYQKEITSCIGCYLKCTTEISQIFNLSIFELIRKGKALIRTYKL